MNQRFYSLYSFALFTRCAGAGDAGESCTSENPAHEALKAEHSLELIEHFGHARWEMRASLSTAGQEPSLRLHHSKQTGYHANVTGHRDMQGSLL